MPLEIQPYVHNIVTTFGICMIKQGSRLHTTSNNQYKSLYKTSRTSEWQAIVLKITNFTFLKLVKHVLDTTISKKMYIRSCTIVY